MLILYFLYFLSVPIDQLESDGTEFDAMNDYFRLFVTNGQMNGLFSCGLTYEDFLGGAYFQCFDLTTSQEPGLRYAIPSVRVGNNIFLNFYYCLLFGIKFHEFILSVNLTKYF